MTTLYEINQELMSLIDDETGEITDLEKWNELNLTADQKIENIGCWIKNLYADIAALKKEEDNLAKRRTTAKNRVKFLKRHLEGYLNGQKFETARVRISFRKSESLEILNTAKIPDEYLKFDVKVDKQELKKAVKEGLELDGVRLMENQNIQIK